MATPAAVLLPLEAHRLLRWLELRDAEVAAHALRVARLAGRLGRELCLDGEALVALDLGARLHDLGKGFLPTGLIHKRGVPTPGERALLRSHAAAGETLMAAVGLPREVQVVAAAHHEWWDGLGYPMGLRGRDIPFTARITAVADAFDAMTAPRDYRETWTGEAAAAEILAGAGAQFCPDVVAAFATIFDPDLVAAG